MKTRKTDKFNADVYHFFNDTRVTSLAGACSDPYYAELFCKCAEHKYDNFTQLLYLAYTKCIFSYDASHARFVKVHLDKKFLTRIENEFYVPKLYVENPVRLKRTDGRILNNEGLYIGCLVVPDETEDCDDDLVIKPFYFSFSADPTNEFRNFLCSFNKLSIDANLDELEELYKQLIRSIIKYTDEIEKVKVSSDELNKYHMISVEANEYYSDKSEEIDCDD